MAPKLPGKFDDIPKGAADVLKNDFQCSGYQLSAKQKTGLDDAVATTTVDFFKPKSESKTPAKLSWKFPKPFGIKGFAVDKLEFATDGKISMDFSAKEALHGVKDLTLEAKAGEMGVVDDLKLAISYGGFKDSFFKFETKATAPDKFTGECLYGVGKSVLGCKFNGAAGCPVVAANFTKGPFFLSCVAEDQVSAFTGHMSYKASDDLTLAKTYQLFGKKNGQWGVAAAYKVDKSTTVKAKVDSTMTVSAAVKHDVVKGLNVNAGVGFNINSSATTFGCKVSIE
jgi:hypothetical protein